MTLSIVVVMLLIKKKSRKFFFYVIFPLWFVLIFFSYSGACSQENFSLIIPTFLMVSGCMMNYSVITLNKGKMPVSENFDGNIEPYNLSHCLINPKTRLKWFGDIIDFRISYVSIGDVLITVGALLFFVL